MHAQMGALASPATFVEASELRKTMDDYDAAMIALAKNGTKVPGDVKRKYLRLWQSLEEARTRLDFSLFDAEILKGLEQAAKKCLPNGTVFYTPGAAAHTAMIEYGKEVAQLFRQHFETDLAEQSERGQRVERLLTRLEFIYFEYSDEAAATLVAPWPLLSPFVIEEIQKELRLYAGGFGFVSRYFYIAVVPKVTPICTGCVHDRPLRDLSDHVECGDRLRVGHVAGRYAHSEHPTRRGEVRTRGPCGGGKSTFHMYIRHYLIVYVLR